MGWRKDWWLFFKIHLQHSYPKSLSVTVPGSGTFSFEICHIYAIPLYFLIMNLFLTMKRWFVGMGNNFCKGMRTAGKSQAGISADRLFFRWNRSNGFKMKCWWRQITQSYQRWILITKFIDKTLIILKCEGQDWERVCRLGVVPSLMLKAIIYWIFSILWAPSL